MSTGGQVHPAEDAWVVAVYASEDGDEPLGSGVVIDDRRILTCAHVANREKIWVGFPKASDGASDRRLPVARVVLPQTRASENDLAMLHLPGPVPADVPPAPLRCPKPNDLVTKRWWAFGFPDQNAIGNAADGHVGAALGHGWIRLDTDSKWGVRPGFSGGGLWSPDYRAVVAVVGRAGKGDGAAITLHQVDQWFPSENIKSLSERWFPTQAGELALSAWGWSLAADREGPRHWRPRARGVSIDSERGYRFRGRTAALQAIKTWLDRNEPDRRVLVITGAPGVGKSAVLGRIVTTADAEAVAQLPATDTGVRATTGSVSCAVHAKGKTALEVATEIARAASSALPENVEDFAPALRDSLSERAALSEQGRRFNVLIDALDEAATPAEARAVVTKVTLPIAETCADTGAQVIVASRRTDAEGNLLNVFGGAERLIDLDKPEFFAEADLSAYALLTLQLKGDERPGNPYSDESAAAPLATRIAELSQGNFLVAGLTARTHALYDEVAVAPSTLSFTPKVDTAMRDYLSRIPPVPATAIAPAVSAETLLTALAFAEAPGLPAPLWRTALRALGAGDIPEATLTRFAKSSAASFLVESSGDNGQPASFRLFHQALNDALLHTRAEFTDRADDERALTRAFLDAGRDGGWDKAPAYLLRSLPAHAASGHLVDDLLTDDDYPLHADLRRVLEVVGQADSPAAQDRGRLLGLTPEAVTAGPPERAAMFSVTEALDDLGGSYRTDRRRVPYRVQWATAEPRRENLVLQGHQSMVNAVCTVRAGNRTLLATTSDDQTVRLWDPTDGSQVRVLEGHRSAVRAVCEIQAGNRTLLATTSGETVRLWDPTDGSCLHVVEGHQDEVRAVCAVQAGNRTLLATTSRDRTVRLWDPTNGSCTRTLEGHLDWVNAVCAVQTRNHTLLATGSRDGTVRLWDPTNGSCTRILEGHRSAVRAVCEIQAGNRTLLATTSDRTVRLWDPTNGSCTRILKGYLHGGSAMCEIQAGNRTLLATTSDDGTARLWDTADGTQLRVLEVESNLRGNAVCAVQTGNRTLLATTSGETVRLWDLRTVSSGKDLQAHSGWVRAVCEIQTGNRTFLATTSDDQTVRLWDPVNGTQTRVLKGHLDPVVAVCAVRTRDRTLLAAATDEGAVRLWDPTNGSQIQVLEGRRNRIRAVCMVRAGNRTLLAAAVSDGTVRLWDPTNGPRFRTLKGHQDAVEAVCEIQAGNRTLLATASDDQTVRLWDPVGRTQTRVLKGHQDRVLAVCEIQAGNRTFLATASDDQTARLWTPTNGSCVRILEGHQGTVEAVCAMQTENRTLLATASTDRTVRLWNPSDGRCVLTVPVHHEALAIASVGDSLAVGLTAGLLVIKLEPNLLA